MNNSTRNFSPMTSSANWRFVQLRSGGDRRPQRESDEQFDVNACFTKQHEKSWPKNPRHIEDCATESSAFSPELIPEGLRAWTVDIAERTQMPTETVVVPALVALSCAVAGKLAIQPKKHDDWSIMPNLWGGVIGATGFLKSAATNEAFAPLRILLADDDGERRSCEVQQFIRKAQSSAYANMIKTATKRRDIVTIDQLQDKIENMIRDAEREQPRPRPFITTDSRRGNITRLIEKSPHGLLIIRGHLDNWLRRLSKPKHDDEREFFLGLSDVCSPDAGQASSVEQGAISSFGEFSEDELRKFLKKARKKQRHLNLLQRFQLLIFHDDKMQSHAVDRRPDYEAREYVNAIFKLVHESPRVKSDTAPTVRFSDEAQEIYDQWVYELKLRVVHAERESPHFAEHIATYHSLMPSLALLFSILERPENIYGWNSVSAAATELAVRWCEFLEQHALKAYHGDAKERNAAIRRIVKDIEHGNLSEGSKLKKILREHCPREITPRLVRSAVARLEESGWLRVIERGGAKRIMLHPKFQSNVNPSPIRPLCKTGDA